MPRLHHGGSLDESGAVWSEESKLGALIVKGFPRECKGIVKNEANGTVGSGRCRYFRFLAHPPVAPEQKDENALDCNRAGDA